MGKKLKAEKELKAESRKRTQGSPEKLPGFDLAASLKRLQGNKRLFRKPLLDFGANYRGVAGEIREV